MSDQVEVWRALGQGIKEARAAIGVKCPECVRLLPRAQPAILLPNHVCRIHRYRDPRPESELDDWYAQRYGTVDAIAMVVPVPAEAEGREAVVQAMLSRWEGAPCAVCGVPMDMAALQHAVGAGPSVAGLNGLPSVMHLACWQACGGDKTAPGEMSP